MSLFRTEPPEYCARCGREVMAVDRAVVIDARSIWHRDCYLRTASR